MSTFSHTDWTVICNGKLDDGSPCPAYGRTDVTGGETAGQVRAILKKQGSAIAVPDPSRNPGDGWRKRTLDFCPDHKKREGQR